MKNTSTVAALAALMLCLGTSTVLGQAGEATTQGDGSVVFQAGVDGPEIVWNPDGSIKRISMRYDQPVDFADRRGIHTAQVIAEEKAKAEIVRFMHQDVQSARFVGEVDNTLGKTIQHREAGAHTQTDERTRTMITNLTETTGSFAKGELGGVILLEKGYDKDQENAWVVVGISEKTIRAAQGLHDAISAKPTPQDMTSPESNAPQPRNGGDVLRVQPSEIRRSRPGDW